MFPALSFRNDPEGAGTGWVVDGEGFRWGSHMGRAVLGLRGMRVRCTGAPVRRAEYLAASKL